MIITIDYLDNFLVHYQELKGCSIIFLHYEPPSIHTLNGKFHKAPPQDSPYDSVSNKHPLTFLLVRNKKNNDFNESNHLLVLCLTLP